MKKLRLLYAAAFLGSALMFTGCSDDDEETPVVNDEFRVDNNITSNTTWQGGKTYILGQRISVEDGATLTIEAGCVIKGEAGQGANASALVIARGAKIMAMGTNTLPIVFTSIADEITPEDVAAGNLGTPNLDANTNGLWGGVIILGRAPISVASNAKEASIEGIPPTDPNGLYGGDDAADNSGVVNYISIRHGGSNIGDGNEINGLTLGGVGTGTEINGVEIVANQDDGLENFGGTVNCSNVLVLNVGDDQFDMDQAYAGTVDNFIGIGGSETDHMMELDGPEGNLPGTFTLTNGSLKCYQVDQQGTGDYADLRDGCLTNISNVYMFNGFYKADFELDDDGTSAAVSSGATTFTNHEINISHLDSGNRTVDAIYLDKSSLGNAFTTVAPSSFANIVTSPTTGADKAAFAGWTWAEEAGLLTDF